MIAEWMLRALLAAAFVGLGAVAAERALANAGRPRRWVWAGALGASVALPVLAYRWPLSMSAGLSSLLADGSGWLPSVLALAGSDAAPEGAAGSGGEAGLGAGLDVVLVLLWAAGSLAVATALLWTNWRVGRTSRTWPRVAGHDDPPVLHGADAGPAVVGVFRPRIVVPRWLLAGPESDLGLVILHEREHVRARDPWLLVAGAAALVLLPWNVALWWQHRRLRAAVELDCDARVLAHGVERPAYGRILLRTAGRGTAVPALPLATSTSMLERRIRAMTERSPTNVRARAVPLLAGATMAAAVACDVASPDPVAPEVERMEAAAAPDAGSTREAEARRALVLQALEGLDGRTIHVEGIRAANRGITGRPVVFIDGARAEDEALQELAPEAIERIEVLRGAAAAAAPEGDGERRDVIRIRTVQAP